LHERATFILTAEGSRLFLFGAVKGVLVGCALIGFSIYLMFKTPEELKRRPWLRRFRRVDWTNWFLAGIGFTSFSAAAILHSLPDFGYELSETLYGLKNGLFIVAGLAWVGVVMTNILQKFKE
jgi:hypothetical protein